MRPGGRSTGLLTVLAFGYAFLYIPIALGIVSFVTIWLLRDFHLAEGLLRASVGDSVKELTFATIPLFTLMGLIVSKGGLGADVYDRPPAVLDINARTMINTSRAAVPHMVAAGGGAAVAFCLVAGLVVRRL